MRLPMPTLRALFPLLVLASLGAMGAAAACGPRKPPPARTALDRPEPTPTIDPEAAARVRERMHEVARLARELDFLLRQPVNLSATERARAALLLSRMERIAATLDGPDAVAAHPALARNGHRFEEEIAAARHGIEGQVPSYFLAGTIIGSCSGCHDNLDRF